MNLHLVSSEETKSTATYTLIKCILIESSIFDYSISALC